MIANLKPYPDLKESGVPWMNQIPTHWTVLRGKYLFRCIDVRSTNGEEELLTVSSERGVVRRSSAVVTMFQAESYAGYKLCWPNDLVINSLWAWAGGLGVSQFYGIVSSAYGVYRLRERYAMYSSYIHRLVRSTPFNLELRVRSKGIWISRLQLTDEAFLDSPFPVPPEEEQSAIVRFLDHVDRRIQRYIGAKQKLIALMEEHKQALIHQAITGKMHMMTGQPYSFYKSSGVKWLGAVPKHWETRRLKWVTRLQRGYDLPADHRVPGPYPVVSSGGFIDTHTEAKCPGPGVVMGRYGSTDSVFYVEQDFWPHNTSLFVTDFFGNNREWCYYLLSTITKEDHAGKSAVPGIDRKDLFEIVVPVPPLTEQQETVLAIRDVTRRATKAIATLHQEISSIREYRDRLTDDVVTGHVDVRGAVSNLPSIAPSELEDLPVETSGKHTRMSVTHLG